MGLTQLTNMLSAPNNMAEDKLTLFDLISIEELQQLQDTLATMHKVTSFITDAQGRSITVPTNEISVCRIIRKSPKGSVHCRKACWSATQKKDGDNLRICRICRRIGILKAAVPIKVNNIHLADWWVSQYCGPAPSQKRLRHLAGDFGLCLETLTNAFHLLPRSEEEKFYNIIKWIRTLSYQFAGWAFKNHILYSHLSRLNLMNRALQFYPSQGFASNTIVNENAGSADPANVEALPKVVVETLFRKITEASKIKNERCLSLVLESANEGIWDFSPLTGHVCYSSRWFTMLGYQYGDFPDTLETWRTFTHPDDLHILDTVIYSLVSGKSKSFTIEIRMLSRPGKWYWLQVRGRTAASDGDGQATRIVGTLIDISKYKQIEMSLHKANAELQRLATMDDMTQIANRRRFDHRLADEWSRGQREKHNLAVIICDIDYFKDYNDTYGHLKGDEVLYSVAQAIRAVLKRPTDLVARFGGEEFATILPCTDIIGARRVAEEFKTAVDTLAIEHKSSKVSQTITLSFGAAAIVPSPGVSAKALVADADQALYRAKSMGRNKIVCASGQRDQNV